MYLCCGKEVNIGEQYCQICSNKRVNVVESSTQADFVDIDGYVDDHLQKQLLELTQEKSNTQSEMCIPDISITDENDCYDLTHNIGIRSTDVIKYDREIMTNDDNLESNLLISSLLKRHLVYMLVQVELRRMCEVI